MYFVTAVSMVALSSATGALAASQVKLVNMYKGKTFFDGRSPSQPKKNVPLTCLCRMEGQRLSH
jgi:hypothetical protein